MNTGPRSMRWQKLGLIFDPRKHHLPQGCEEYAQAPQALVLADRVRIYFSTRAIDNNGKYRSHIAYVDMSHSLKSVIGTSQHTVLPLGDLGTYDEHGIFPMSVLPVGHEVWGYTTGWSRRVSVSVDTAIGLVISQDNGKSFKRQGDGPIMGSSLHEPFLVGDACVRLIKDKFHMWYIFGTEWKRYLSHDSPERTYKIAHATSHDGIHWIKDEALQIIPDRLGSDESQALPTVIEVDGRYLMVYCYRESYDFRANHLRSYKIGHAWSSDLENWTRSDDNPRLDIEPHDWDSKMQCYPHTFLLNGEVFLLYNGNAFGRTGFGAAKLI